MKIAPSIFWHFEVQIVPKVHLNRTKKSVSSQGLKQSFCTREGCANNTVKQSERMEIRKLPGAIPDHLEYLCYIS